MITPQMPTGHPVGEAVFDHHSHRQRNDPLGIVAPWRSQVDQVGTEIFLADRTVMLRVGEMNITRSPRNQIPNVVQASGKHPIRAAIPT